MVTIALTIFLYPHGGRTNSQGCHNQRGGSYYWHNPKVKTKYKRIKKKNHQVYGIKSSVKKYNCANSNNKRNF